MIVYFEQRNGPNLAWYPNSTEIAVQVRTEITAKNAAVKQFKDSIPRGKSNLYRNIRAGEARALPPQ